MCVCVCVCVCVCAELVCVRVCVLSVCVCVGAGLGASTQKGPIPCAFLSSSGITKIREYTSSNHEDTGCACVGARVCVCARQYNRRTHSLHILIIPMTRQEFADSCVVTRRRSFVYLCLHTCVSAERSIDRVTSHIARR